VVYMARRSKAGLCVLVSKGLRVCGSGQVCK